MNVTAILGISAFYHDSAAALVVDGRIVAAAQEERFTRRKHDAEFPHHAVGYCLDEAGVTLDELDHVVFYDKPFLKFERLLETYIALAPRGFGDGNRLEISREIHFPHSLGLLYSAVTYYTGFKVNSGEYKVMGLAPYGEPKYAKLILDHLIDLKPDGSFRLDMSYFDYCTG